jgi:hypothetical protein
MAEFFTTRGIAFNIDEIINKGKKFVYLVTPYLKFSDTLHERLKSLNNKSVKLIIVYGKTELNFHQDKLLKELNCSIYFKENLHAKCYANESEALICSMNLHSFSEANNIEMGVKIHHRSDRVAYESCIDEIKQLINNADPIRMLDVEEINGPDEYGFEEFSVEWLKLLQKSFPEIRFSVEDNRITADDFPLPGIQFSNSYGFSTFELPGNHFSLSRLKDKHCEGLYVDLADYRCYWSSPFTRICLYHQKGAEFKSVGEDADYCLYGTKKLIEQLRKMTFD